MKNWSIYTWILIFPFVLLSQRGKKNSADKKFEDFAYVEAISSYEKLEQEGHNDEEIYKKLGVAHYNNANYSEAAKWLEKLLVLKTDSIDPEYLYTYSQSLKSLGQYKKSDRWMKKFNRLSDKDSRVQKFLKSPDYLETIKNNSGRAKVSNLEINSSESDFSPSFFGNHLVFASARDTSIATALVHNWNQKPFLNLYSAPYDEQGESTMGPAALFSKQLNSKVHESSTVFTKDMTTVYFTRNNAKKGKFARDDNGVSRLKIYKASYIDGKWRDVKELPFNHRSYSTAHPALSSDEKTLYFASDMPGTRGKSDIFKVAINNDGTYGTPINLGPKINTEGRETFPFIERDRLYFASDGHPGLGGLDIFACLLESDNKDVLNLGEPINSIEDDFSFIINKHGKGFFASNRKNGKGNDDIYAFTETDPLQFYCELIVEGYVKDSGSGEAIPFTIVNIEKEGKRQEVVTDSLGYYTYLLACQEKTIQLLAEKTGYQGSIEELVVNADKKKVRQDLFLAKIEDDLALILELNPIYFDFDRWNIRADAEIELKKVIDYLSTYKQVKVDIRSHTDSRGDNDYNMWLSVKRAQSTMIYLIEKGITKNRLTSNGYGETQLKNKCKDNIPCSRSQHQLNRRSEFIVTDN